MTKRRGERALAAIAFDWLGIIGVALIAEKAGTPLVRALAIIVIARQMNALFELHHHAMHGNLFRRPVWNTRMQFLYSLPLGVTVDSDRADHMVHHRTFNTVEKDYETWGRGYGLDPARRGRPSYMIWFLCVRPFVGRLQVAEVVEFIRAARGNAAGIFWLAVTAGFVAAKRPDLLFWYWIVPRFTAYPILFFWDDMFGHYNCARTGTRELRGLWFQLFSTHGTNFHNIHHLYPAIPWFNMKHATTLAIDETQVDVADGFVDGMRQMVFSTGVGRGST